MSSPSLIADTKKRIRRVYKSKENRRGTRKSNGEDIRDWIVKSQRKGRAVPEDIKLWLVFFDEAIAFWFVVWAIYRERLDVKGRSAVLDICLFTLAGRVFQDFVCVRDLTTSGFFVQSNVVLRSSIEAIDIMHILNLEPSLAEEFRDAEDNEAANSFWHKHCSRNKIHKKIRQRWLWFFADEGEAVDKFHGLREHYLDLVGMSAHPSFPSSFVTFMDSPDGSGSDNIFEAALGRVSHMSKFSIHLALLRVFEYGILWSGPKLSLYKEDAVPFESSLSESVSKGLSVLLSILISAGGDRGGAHPYFPQFKTYWPESSFDGTKTGGG